MGSMIHVNLKQNSNIVLIFDFGTVYIVPVCSNGTEYIRWKINSLKNSVFNLSLSEQKQLYFVFYTHTSKFQNR